MALSEDIPGSLGKAGRRVTYTLSDSARPETTSAAGGRGSQWLERVELGVSSRFWKNWAPG
eukprot:1714265-Amphidinium_carterae.2